MHVAAADASGFDLDEYVIGTHFGDGEIDQFEVFIVFEE